MTTLPDKANFRPDEVALLCELSRCTILRYIREGKLEHVHLSVKVIRIPRDAVLRFLEGREGAKMS